MQYDVQTPQEYLQALDPDWRRDKLEELRSIIKSVAPELNEGIAYKMLAYGDGENLVLALNAQKHYVSLYVGDISKIDPDGSLLAGLNLGKGCIRFSKTKVISETRIKEFLESAMNLWRRGEDVYC